MISTTIIDPASMLWGAWRYRLRHDRAEIAFLRKHLQPGDTAIDIGAHKGAYTWWMARAVGLHGRVLCFEPQPVLARRLTALQCCALFRDTLRPVQVSPWAISNCQGQATMQVDGPDSSPNATLGKLDGRDEAWRYTVDTTTLDAWLAEHPGPPLALIKIDVEGHEAAVFAGAEQTLHEHRPALLFECERRHHPDATIAPVFEFLAEAGYQGWFAFGRQWLPIDDFDADRHQVPGQRPYANNFLFK